MQLIDPPCLHRFESVDLLETKSARKGVRKWMYEALAREEEERVVSELQGIHRPIRSRRKRKRAVQPSPSHGVRYLEISDGLKNRLPIWDARGPAICSLLSWQMGNTDFYTDRRAQSRNALESYDFKEPECRLCGSGTDSPTHVLTDCARTASIVALFDSFLGDISSQLQNEFRGCPPDLRGKWILSVCMMPLRSGVDHYRIFERGDSVVQPVRKEQRSECERAQREFMAIASNIYIYILLTNIPLTG